MSDLRCGLWATSYCPFTIHYWLQLLITHHSLLIYWLTHNAPL